MLAWAYVSESSTVIVEVPLYILIAIDHCYRLWNGLRLITVTLKWAVIRLTESVWQLKNFYVTLTALQWPAWNFALVAGGIC